MFRLTPSTNSPIGIDVGARHFAAIQLAGRPSERRVIAAVLLARTESGSIPSLAELTRLLGVLNRSGFSGRRIVLAAPVEKTFGGVLELPRGSSAAQSQMARMELARTLRCPPDAFELGCWEVPAIEEDAKTAQVMTVACKHDDANTLLDAFEAAGFFVQSLDSRCCALARVAAALTQGELMKSSRSRGDFQLIHQSSSAAHHAEEALPTKHLAGEFRPSTFRQDPSSAKPPQDDAQQIPDERLSSFSSAPAQEGMTAVLEMDWRFASLVLLHRGRVVYERKLADAELVRLHDGLCQRLHIEADVADYLLMETGLAPADDQAAVPRQARAMLSAHIDAMNAELSASLAYAGRQYPQVLVDRLLLCGPGAKMPGVEHRIAEVLRLETRILCPSEVFTERQARHDAAHSPSLVTACGLAMADD